MTALAMQSAPALSVRGLGRRYGGVHAVRDVGFDVPVGERRVILGPNGAGKTTLFDLIAGDVRPTAGEITIFGTRVTDMSLRRRVRMGVARTYQQSRLFGGLSVAENLFLAHNATRPRRSRLGTSSARAGADRDVQATAERVALDGDLATPAGELSHGKRRQLEVGLALAAAPQLLLLDEPAAGLSPVERQMLSGLLLALGRDITLVLIEHDMDIALAVADVVTVMHDGWTVLEGTPEQASSSQTVKDIYLGGNDA